MKEMMEGRKERRKGGREAGRGRGKETLAADHIERARQPTVGSCHLTVLALQEQLLPSGFPD